ncbi:phytosulfokines-like [Lotus japonicus]|uniref:Phytosulfokine n=1 Tax=Lotus japonicus TaxID=34305 RepID=A0A097C2Y7_LOTJA|nr:phytosulfokines-like [Lotus japonicus]AIS76461.1 phytosulfokine-alpha precursor 4 [Lotus japonicus]
MMSKIKGTALFFTILFLCYMLTQSARPEPDYNKESLDVEEVDRSCEGITEEEEECLNKKTLAAHIDYIYTQKHNNP